MRKILLIGTTFIGAVMFAATPVSVKYSAIPSLEISSYVVY